MGDVRGCIDGIEMADVSLFLGYSVFSPAVCFAIHLLRQSSIMGNCRNHAEFFEHFA